MAPPKSKKTKSQYEERREEIIRRNRERLAPILEQKAKLFPAKPKRPFTRKPNPPPTERRRSPRSSSLLNSRPPPPPSSLSDAFLGYGSYRPLADAVCSAGEGRENRRRHVRKDGFDARVQLGLEERNLMYNNQRIAFLRFFPASDRSIVISGNRLGHLGFWDVDFNGEEDSDSDSDSDGVFLFSPHKYPVSGISVHPDSVTKIYSSSHNCDFGYLCLMDMEKEKVDMIYSSHFPIFSLSQSPHDHNSLLLGSKGKVISFDERTGKSSDTWELHNERVNTIDFHPGNSNLVATSSKDGFMRIWDLRCVDTDKPNFVKEAAHKSAVESAYFSPTGDALVSTSFDGTVRIFNGRRFGNLSVMQENPEGCWLSTSSATWGWNDSYIFIGNRQRAIDVISTKDETTTRLESEYMTNVPCQVAAHPYKEGYLACAGGTMLYLWTKK